MDDLRETVLRKIEDQKDELIGFLQMLVRAPSMFGSERQAQDVVAGKLRDIGMTVDMWEPNRQELSKHPAYTETPRDYASRPDVVGLMKGLGGGQSLILNGHIDVVSPEPVSSWKFDPWAATIKDGRMYGR